MRQKVLIMAVAILFLFILPLTVIAGDWPQFRGKQGNGKAQATNIPVTWDGNQNIVWKTKLSGPGASSPIILGKRIYLTSYSGYGESIDESGNMDALKRHVICLDRDSGDVVWDKTFDPKLPESKYQGRNSTRHGYATSTIATDGEKLFVFFGSSGVYALDLKGEVIWHREVGTGTHGWGSGTSPLVYKDKVIINASVESKSMLALDKKTGEVLWTAEGIKSCWSTPTLVHVNGKQEIVLNVPKKLTGFDPETGVVLWHCEGIPDSYVCPTVLAEGGVVYAIGGRKNTAIAVRAGGRGDVSDSHVLWRVKKGSNVTSPVYLDGYLYWTHESRGQVYCLNAKTGEVVFEGTLSPKPGLIYASGTAVDGKIYFPSQDNGTYVIAAKPEFAQLAVNKFEDDKARVNASVAVSKNQLIMRTDQAIYCIGQ